MKLFLPLLLSGLLWLPAAPAVAGYLGWIPVQVVPREGQLDLDLRRFWERDPGEVLHVAAADASGVEAQVEDLTLRLRVTGSAAGLVDLPLEVRGAAGNVVTRGVLTIAVAEPGQPAGADLPVVFVDEHSSGTLSFRVSPTGADTKISAVVQNPDGSSVAAPVPRRQDGRLTFATTDLPAGAWLRVAVADGAGRISRVARAEVRPREGFRWQDGVMYYAFTDRFANGDARNDRRVADEAVLAPANYQGGDFAGIQRRITDGYFRKLGVNVLWLAPLNQNPTGGWKEYLPPYRTYTGYHGYWPVSHTEVESRFGGADALRELVQEARSGGIKIIADLVLKHVHVDHPLWREHPEWFGRLELPDGRKNLRLWDEQQFTTWFEEWLPGFDFENPEPVKFLLGTARYWVEEFHLDGYRLDAVKHIPYAFWPKFRTTMRNVEREKQLAPLYFVGETFMDRRGIMSFVGPNMLDGQFDFPLYDTIIEVLGKGTGGFDALEKSLSESETIYGKETLMSPLVGNHDKSRFMAYADGDLPKAGQDDEEEIGWADPPRVDHAASYDKLKMAFTFILAIDGVPMIYYGDEVGLTGAGDPDNRRMMPEERDLTAAQRSVRDHLAKAAGVRQAHPALRYGSRRMVVAEAQRYAFVRRYFGDVVLAAWNKGDAPATFELAVGPEMPDGVYENAFTGDEVRVASGTAKFSLPARTSALIVARK